MRLSKLNHWKKSAAPIISIFGQLISADYLPSYLYWTSRSYYYTCTCTSTCDESNKPNPSIVIEPFMRTLKANLTASNRLMEKLSTRILPLLPTTTNTGVQLADLLDDTLTSGDRLWGILLKILRECERSSAASAAAAAAERVFRAKEAEQQERPMVVEVMVEKGKERIFFEKVFESEELAELTGEFEAWNEQARTEARVSENRLVMTSRYG